MDVETVCTEADFGGYVAGQLTGQTKLLPVNQTSVAPQRQQALDDVLAALARRTPPIRATDLAVPSELKRAVQFGTEMWLLYLSLTTASADSATAFRYAEARRRFVDEINGLTPTLVGGLRGSTFSFGISRR